MATKKELISDVELRLTKGKPSDDFEVDKRQISFQLDIVRSALIKSKAKEESKDDFSDFVTLYEAVEVYEEAKIADDGESAMWVKSRLPEDVMSLQEDMGVYSIETQGGVEIKRIKAIDRIRFKHLKFGKSSKANPTYYRVDQDIYYQGGTDNWKKNGVVNMYLILETVIDSDSDYPISTELIPLLLETVTNTLMQQMNPQLKQDLNNDGAE